MHKSLKPLQGKGFSPLDSGLNVVRCLIGVSVTVCQSDHFNDGIKMVSSGFCVNLAVLLNIGSMPTNALMAKHAILSIVQHPLAK